jgi:hypothetical protein
MNSSGNNSNLAAIGSTVAPAIANSPLTIGTGTGQGFQPRTTGSATQTAIALLAAISGQFVYITDIHWTYIGTGNPILTLVANANGLQQQDIFMETNKSDSRVFRNPWKTMSTSNNALNYAISGTFTGTWTFNVHGYYQNS